MAKRQKKFQFSSIIPKKFTGNLPRMLRVHLLRGGKLYDEAYGSLRIRLQSKMVLDKRTLDTIMAFSKNHYIEHHTLPSIEQLEKIFRLQRKPKKPYPKGVKRKRKKEPFPKADERKRNPRGPRFCLPNNINPRAFYRAQRNLYDEITQKHGKGTKETVELKKFARAFACKNLKWLDYNTLLMMVKQAQQKT